MVTPATETPELDAAIAKLTPKKQSFVAEYLKSWDGRKFNITNAAIAAGFSPKTAYAAGSRMFKDVEVFECVQLALRPKVVGAISSIQERKETLTEIHRGRLHHFGTAGADGFIPDVGPENLNSAALAQIETRVEVDKAAVGDAKNVAFITKLKLESKTQAIDLLNKMEGVYAAAEPGGNGSGLTVNFNIIAGARSLERPAIDVPSEIVQSPRLKKTFALSVAKKAGA